MSTCHGAFKTSDTAKLLVLIMAVTALFAAAFVSIPDQSSADPAPSETYYYDQLSDLEKKIYNKFDEGYNVQIDGTDGLVVSYSIDLTEEYAGRTVGELSTALDTASSRILRTMYWEHPEYYWLNISGGIKVPFTYHYTGEDLGNDNVIQDVNVTVKYVQCYDQHGTSYAEINGNVNAIKSAISGTTLASGSTYATLKNIHDFVCSTLSYTEEKPIPNGPGLRNLYTALLGDHVVVCEAYAKLFKALCDQYDIPSIIVAGDAGTDSEKEGHMWNYVYINNCWYHVDCTWDDQSTMVYTYFLAGSTTVGFNSATIASSYIIDTDITSVFTVPTISTTSYENSTFTVTFLNYDGSVYQTLTDLAYNTVLKDEMTFEDPTYVNANIGTFAFTGWAPVITNETRVVDNVSYTAVYDIDYVEYTVNFNVDGAPVSTKTDYHYGDAIVAPENPTKAGTDFFTYTFIRWDPVLAEDIAVTGNATYNAVFECAGNVEATESYELTASVLADISTADRFNVTLKGSDGSALAKVSFDHDAIGGLSAGQTLTVSKIDTSAVPEAVRTDLEKATIYRVDFGTNNTAFSSGKATVSLYYVKTTLDNIGGLNLYYINGDTLESVPYTYQDNYVVFETNHFSEYAIKNSLGLSGFMWYVPIVVILILTFIGFALAYRFS